MAGGARLQEGNGFSGVCVMDGHCYGPALVDNGGGGGGGVPLSHTATCCNCRRELALTFDCACSRTAFLSLMATSLIPLGECYLHLSMPVCGPTLTKPHDVLS